MIPLRDSIQSQSRPVMTMTLIATNVLVALYQFFLSPEANAAFVDRHALVAARFWSSLHAPFDILFSELFTPVSAMFLHGGIFHLAGNMLFLWIFGDNIEDQLGKARFFTFYLTTGLIATASELLITPQSMLPMLGASGAVAGVLGAYLRFYPSARVQAILPIFIFIQFVEVPAVFFLGLWFVGQLFGSLAGETNVAWFAHITGFVSGFLIASLLPRPQNPPPRSRASVVFQRSRRLR